ncbi:UDP-N-acetylmuramoyl-L-alanine--D-glutamate ligase [Patescibacteria group bacterium]
MRIVIMGLGSYEKGSGISAAKFFIGKDADILITDLKSQKELAHQIRSIEKFCKSQKKPLPKFRLGGHKKEDFCALGASASGGKNVDIVMRNPGVRKNSPYLKLARAGGAKIETDISIFLKNCPAKVIGVTGTRGKSTTTSLIYEMLKGNKQRVWLGGNIQISPLSFVDKVRKGDVVVLELSSWMLENFDEFKLAPHIAVVTNIYRDHLNAHKNMAEYISAKKLIFKHQEKGDYLILNGENKKTQSWKKRGAIYFYKKDVRVLCHSRAGGNLKIKLQGEHNLENIAAALKVAKVMKVSNASVKKVLREFKGIPDRQELIADKSGIKYINDTTATSPDGAIAALKTLGRRKNIILIAGGADKKLEYKEFTKEVKKYCKAVILLPGTATHKMKKELGIRNYELRMAENMKEAVHLAKEQATKGDIVLLSPAAASFGLFKNEFDRGEEFKKHVTRNT